jgi:hypothetical protein
MSDDDRYMDDSTAVLMSQIEGEGIGGLGNRGLVIGDRVIRDRVGATGWSPGWHKELSDFERRDKRLKMGYYK